MPTLKSIHIAKSHNADRTSQNLSISMSLPTLKKELTKFEIMNEIIKHESTTKAIRNAGKVLNMSLIESNNKSAKLKINRFKIPHYA